MEAQPRVRKGVRGWHIAIYYLNSRRIIRWNIGPGGKSVTSTRARQINFSRPDARASSRLSAEEYKPTNYRPISPSFLPASLFCFLLPLPSSPLFFQPLSTLARLFNRFYPTTCSSRVASSISAPNF